MQSFNVLLASLDVRGNREAQLHSMLQRIEARFKESVSKMWVDVPEAGPIGSGSPSSTVSIPNTDSSEFSSTFAIEHGQNGDEMTNAIKRYQNFEKWMWRECLNLRAMKFGSTRCENILEVCDNCLDLSFFENGRCSSCHKLCETFFGSNLTFSKHLSRFKEKLKSESVLCFHDRESGRPVRFRLIKALLALIEVSFLQLSLVSCFFYSSKFDL